MKTISVITSVYKNENPKYLDRALQSIWTDQTLKPYEIILVEDGPLPDSLHEVIQRWKDSLNDTLVVLTNNVNLGLTKSLNKGIGVAKGDFIARMDSDDISAPHRFEKQTEFLNSHPEISILGGSIQEFFDEGHYLNIRHYPHSHQEVLSCIYKCSPLAHPSVMMRRDIFSKGGLSYNEKYRTSQDIALWYDAILAGYEISNVSDVVLFFRRDNNMYKRRNKSKAWNEFKIYINGIYRLFGLFTTKYIYPIARLIFRLMPIKIIKWIYGSSFRMIVTER